MSWLALINNSHQERSVAWVLVSTVVALVSGLLGGWLQFRCVKRDELVTAVALEIDTHRTTKAIDADRDRKERVRQEVLRWANLIVGAVEDLDSR